MVRNLALNPVLNCGNVYKTNISSGSCADKNSFSSQNFTSKALLNQTYSVNKINTTLNQNEQKKYIELLSYLKNLPYSRNSQNITPSKQLEILLKNGKLLSKTSHDASSTLDNLYNIAFFKRKQGLNNATLLCDTLDLLVNPRFVTQTFGDIPLNYRQNILNSLKKDDYVKQNPDSMNVQTSGTCAAASIEVNMADKYPSEFTRWVAQLSSEKGALELNGDLDSISKNKLEAIEIINLLEAQKTGFDFNKTKIKVDVDDNAYLRAQIQSTNWDEGERNTADVLVQSAIMKLGSQNTYNSLCDIRGGKFNSNPQGLIELEKTFVESLIKNREITSLVYQQIDDDQNLVGYNCSFDKIKKHITDTIDEGDDVILGYVLTNETSGITKSQNYNSAFDGAPNKIINGHEITVVDYNKDENGKTTFICVDTDDDSKELVTYDENWLLPKIHHAGYPSHIVENDEKEIMQKALENS